MTDDLKILAIDIETMPALVYTYDLWQPIISHKSIVQTSRMLCFSAQWYGTKKTLFFSEYHDGREAMIRELWNLIDEADVVLGYNSRRFDMPWILGELKVEGYTAPSPVKHIDLFQVVKSNSRFLSRKLDYVSSRILGDNKIDVNTMTLAIECVSEDEKVRERAWNKMRRYSKKDTALLLPLFDEFRSYLKMPHPMVDDGEIRCHTCGSTDLQRRGTAKTLTGHYQRYSCIACGSWHRGTKRESSSEIRAL